MNEVLQAIERYTDAASRAALRAEAFGSLVLFYTEEPLDWRYCARPSLGATSVEPADVARARARQRQLDLPEAFEWLDELTPWMGPAMTAAGLHVEAHPLLVFAPESPPPVLTPPGATLSFVTADEADLARVIAVATLAFDAPGTAIGAAGVEDLDAIAAARNPATLALERARIRAGSTVQVVARTEGVPVATGALLPYGEVASIVGVATLPAFRRRGLGQAISARLVGRARDDGARLVFLAAMTEEVAQMYRGVGFERVGTSCSAAPRRATAR